MVAVTFSWSTFSPNSRGISSRSTTPQVSTREESLGGVHIPAGGGGTPPFRPGQRGGQYREICSKQWSENPTVKKKVIPLSVLLLAAHIVVNYRRVLGLFTSSFLSGRFIWYSTVPCKCSHHRDTYYHAGAAFPAHSKR